MRTSTEDLLSRELHRNLDPLVAPGMPPALRRGAVRRRVAVLCVAGLLTISGTTAVWTLVTGIEPASREPSVTAPSASPFGGDEVAAGVIDRLQGLCVHRFGSYYRTMISGFQVRPVQCGMVTRVIVDDDGEPITDPETGFKAEYISGPTLIIHAFDDPRGVHAWLAATPPSWGGRIVGRLWTVDVSSPTMLNEVVDRLGVEDNRVVAPVSELRIGSARFELLHRDVSSNVSADRAVRAATRRYGGELLHLFMARYRPNSAASAAEPRPVWVVVLRACVVSYGGFHAQDDCQGTRTYVAIDLRSGRVVWSGPT